MRSGERGQCPQGFQSAGRAAVDAGFTFGNGISVGAAILEAAAPALGLGQECVD